MKLLDYLKYIILEQDRNDVDDQFSKNIGRISPFNISPSATAAAMKVALKKYGKDFQTLGDTSDFILPGVESEDIKYKPESVERFMQWYSDVIQNPDSVTFRGKAFEGLIAGIFGGEVTNNERTEKDNKTDVQVGNKNLSIKFNEKFNPDTPSSLGGIASSFDRFFKDPENREKFRYLKLPSRITRENLNNFLYQIYNMDNKSEAKNLLNSILNNDDSFGRIDWFVFSTVASKNEIKIYQYKKEDIVNQIIEEIMSNNVNLNNGMLGVKNLSKIPTKSFTLKFPQYLKNLQRYKYKITKNEDPTNDEHFFIIKNEMGEIVANITRQVDTLSDGNKEYQYKLIKLNKYASITKEMELEARNKFVLFDINRLENTLKKLYDERDKLKGRGTRETKQKLDVKIDQLSDIMKKMKKLSEKLSRSLVNEKNKIYKTGVEQDLQKTFGSRGETMSPFIIQQIRKNPDRFFKNFLKIYQKNPKRMKSMDKIFQQIKNEI